MTNDVIVVESQMMSQAQKRKMRKERSDGLLTDRVWSKSMFFLLANGSGIFSLMVQVQSSKLCLGSQGKPLHKETSTPWGAYNAEAWLVHNTGNWHIPLHKAGYS